MANKTARTTVSLSYAGPDNEVMGPPAVPAVGVSAPYAEGGQLVGGIDIPDTTAAETVYEVPFGTIESATSVLIENKTGQEVGVRLGGASVTGVLVSGTASIAFPAVTGERLSAALGAANGGTPGKLHVERSAGNAVVTSYYGSGVQTLDVSSVTVYNNAPPSLPDGGMVVFTSPTAPTESPIASAQIITTATQSGAKSVVTKVFGDPT